MVRRTRMECSDMRFFAITILVIQLMFAIAVGAEMYAQATTLKVNNDRLIYITGTVDRTYSRKVNQIEKFVTASSEKPIYLLINSGGGYVRPGIQFISAMKWAKNRGVKFVCVVPVLAASMAFHIFANCTDRYVFEDAFLLWHEIRLSGQLRMTADELKQEAWAIKMWGKPMDKFLIETMGVSRKFYTLHSKAETMWIARALEQETSQFITIIKDIRGAKDIFKLGR